MSFQSDAFDDEGFDTDGGEAASVAPPPSGRYWFERELRQQALVSTFPVPRHAQQLIETVALRQAQSLETDELKRLEELERELEIEGFEWQTRYLEALNAHREALMDAEIGRLLKAKLEQEEAMTLIMLAAYV